MAEFEKIETVERDFKTCVYMRVSEDDEERKALSVAYICVQERGSATCEKT